MPVVVGSACVCCRGGTRVKNTRKNGKQLFLILCLFLYSLMMGDEREREQAGTERAKIRNSATGLSHNVGSLAMQRLARWGRIGKYQDRMGAIECMAAIRALGLDASCVMMYAMN